MASIANIGVDAGTWPPSGSPAARAIDRWIYVYMAASFIVVTLTGFIPDSIGLVADAKAGAIPPLPLVLHFHAVLMGSFLLLVLAQTTLAATGRLETHRRLGRVAMLLVPALVLVGFILVPTIYHSVWYPAQSAPQPARAELQHLLLRLDNIMLMQLRIGILFPLFIFLGLKARGKNGAFHKRMMILATATPLPAAIDRIQWLPTTLPVSPLSTDLYIVALLSPMIIWDVVRTGTINRAYLVWLGTYVAVSVAVYSAWNAGWWHAIAPRLMGV
ncbi:MAG TPA: hypothetical protein VK533_07340 [Sphingomonas sp.]|uniref:hypothetical protein n=1 Tax=Sphingomonas sp. TaxID=28214 RepID=UPI002B6ED60F|nr:hypothetical protein [Sphingomonas sp.]HMI19341.1 hypothetical protein [Sphingomonas sp.]